MLQSVKHGLLQQVRVLDKQQSNSNSNHNSNDNNNDDKAEEDIK